jgi:AraC-like DNA-binding protein
MPTLRSAQPSPDLRPYVRAYALRKFDRSDSPVCESVPAQLEPVLNLELGIMPGIRNVRREISANAWIGGAQTAFVGHMELIPGVESFAVFFQPAGWWQLFGTPMHETTNSVYDAQDVAGPCMRELWNRLGEQSPFEARVAVVEIFLRRFLKRALPHDRVTTAAMHLFRCHGAIRIPKLALRESISLRQFELRFRQQTGMSPKVFARVARFQAALDAKIANSHLSWLDIAHSFGYHDQMHRFTTSNVWVVTLRHN